MFVVMSDIDWLVAASFILHPHNTKKEGITAVTPAETEHHASTSVNTSCKLESDKKSVILPLKIDTSTNSCAGNSGLNLLSKTHTVNHILLDSIGLSFKQRLIKWWKQLYKSSILTWSHNFL